MITVYCLHMRNTLRCPLQYCVIVFEEIPYLQETNFTVYVARSRTQAWTNAAQQGIVLVI